METKEQLELRQKRVELIAKIDEAKAKRRQYEFEGIKQSIELERMKIELDRLKNAREKKSGVYDICSAISTHIVDNEKTIIATDPAWKNIWTEDEIELLKKKAIESCDQPPRW